MKNPRFTKHLHVEDLKLRIPKDRLKENVWDRGKKRQVRTGKTRGKELVNRGKDQNRFEAPNDSWGEKTRGDYETQRKNPAQDIW